MCCLHVLLKPFGNIVTVIISYGSQNRRLEHEKHCACKVWAAHCHGMPRKSYRDRDVLSGDLS